MSDDTTFSQIMAPDPKEELDKRAVYEELVHLTLDHERQDTGMSREVICKMMIYAAVSLAKRRPDRPVTNRIDDERYFLRWIGRHFRTEYAGEYKSLRERETAQDT